MIDKAMEAAREAFEKYFKDDFPDAVLKRYSNGAYRNSFVEGAYVGWLAAKEKYEANWISVEDRLPEDKGSGVCHEEIDLWCGADKCRYPDAYYFKGKFWDMALDHDGDFDHYFELENITHWMPIQEQPQ